VQKHDPASVALRCYGGDDLVDPRPTPVFAVEVREHDVVAEASDFLERGGLPLGRRGRDRRVRRPEEAWADPDRPGQGVIGQAEL
jgi:hypothetical protein